MGSKKIIEFGVGQTTDKGIRHHRRNLPARLKYRPPTLVHGKTWMASQDGTTQIRNQSPSNEGIQRDPLTQSDGFRFGQEIVGKFDGDFHL